MSTGHIVELKGFKIDKHGRLVRDEKRFNLCKQLTRRTGNKVRPARKGDAALKTGPRGAYKKQPNQLDL